MRKLFTNEELSFIAKHYPTNGIEYCAIALNRNKSVIKQKAYSMGIRLLKRINIEQFLNINTKEIAYILGLIWADGNISFANNNAKTPIVKHTSKPSDNVIFLKILNSVGSWNSFSNKNIGSYAKTPKMISTNWISSRLLGEFLINHNYKLKHLSPDLILSKIPPNLKHYWFRGYFDGDGSVTIKYKGHHSIAFTSCAEQDWGFVVSLFHEIGILNYKIRIINSRGGKSSQIRVSNKSDLLKFEEYLYLNYSDDELGLPRKRMQFNELH